MNYGSINFIQGNLCMRKIVGLHMFRFSGEDLILRVH